MKRRIWKTLVSALLITALLIGAIPVSAASISTNYSKIVEHINEYGEADENGYQTLGYYITVDGGTMYFFIRNRSASVEFQAIAVGDTSTGTDVDLSFKLQKSNNYLTVQFHEVYYENNSLVDELETSKSINRTTHTIESEYTIKGNTNIPDEQASEDFNAVFQVLCLFWHSYFLEGFGFGLDGLGFTAYCIHEYDNDCDASCNLCKAEREASHSYGNWTNIDETNHQQVCSVCGDTVTAEHEWGPLAPGSYAPTCQEDGYQWYYCIHCNGPKTIVTPKSDEYHDFSAWKEVDKESHSRVCDICEKEETAPHNWDAGKLTQLPTEDAPGILTYTCADCGATKTEEVDFIPGDIDGNGTVNRDDVIALLLHVSMPAAFPISIPADYNGDGIVTRDDVIQLLLHVSMPDAFPLQ